MPPRIVRGSASNIGHTAPKYITLPHINKLLAEAVHHIELSILVQEAGRVRFRDIFEATITASFSHDENF